MGLKLQNGETTRRRKVEHRLQSIVETNTKFIRASIQWNNPKCRPQYSGNITEKYIFYGVNLFVQAAYVARLQQQAAQIKQLLKLLNSSGVNPSLNGSSSGTDTSENPTGSQIQLPQDEAHPDNGGYESLWELSERTLTNFPEVETTTEVEEEEDTLEDQEDLYENTGVSAHNFTIAVGMYVFMIMRNFLHHFSSFAFEMRTKQELQN